MKKIICFALLLCLLVPVARAESLEELETRRDALLQELTEVNTAIGKIMKEEKLNGGSEESLGRIIDLFPDETFACIIRDKCGKISIQQTVTQAELDEIDIIVDNGPLYHGYGVIKNITGIGYLTNLYWLELEYNEISALPDEMRNCKALKYVQMQHNELNSITEYIGELTNLSTLDVSYSNISKLPESIGNLENLEYLNIGHTQITELPDSVWNLDLEMINMQGLPIK